MKIIQGLEEIHDTYDAFLVDAWGVLHDGVKRYPGAGRCLQQLKELGKPVVIISNAARRVNAIEIELDRVGIPRDWYKSIVSSGEMTWQLLKSGSHAAQFGSNGYYLGPERSRSVCDDLEQTWVDSPNQADFVLNAGAPTGNPEDAESFRPLLESLAAGRIPMICANPDLIAIRGGQPGISAGAIASIYRSLGDAPVISIGKPAKDIFDLAGAQSGVTGPSTVLVIGDGLATDISGAANAGLDSLFITSGIHENEVTPFEQSRFERCFDRYGAWPDYICKSFCWQEEEA